MVKSFQVSPQAQARDPPWDLHIASCIPNTHPVHLLVCHSCWVWTSTGQGFISISQAPGSVLTTEKAPGKHLWKNRQTHERKNSLIMQPSMGKQRLKTVWQKILAPTFKKVASLHRSVHIEHPEGDTGWRSKEIRVSTNSLVLPEPSSNLESLF